MVNVLTQWPFSKGSAVRHTFTQFFLLVDIVIYIHVHIHVHVCMYIKVFIPLYNFSLSTSLQCIYMHVQYVHTCICAVQVMLYLSHTPCYYEGHCMLCGGWSRRPSETYRRSSIHEDYQMRSVVISCVFACIYVHVYVSQNGKTHAHKCCHRMIRHKCIKHAHTSLCLPVASYPVTQRNGLVSNVCQNPTIRGIIVSTTRNTFREHVMVARGFHVGLCLSSASPLCLGSMAKVGRTTSTHSCKYLHVNTLSH